MTTPHDPIDDARAELARIEPPTERDIAIQRGRLEDAIARTSEPQRAKRRRTRWLPASGIAVAGLAIAVLVGVALQPEGGDERSKGSDPKPRGLQLVTGAPGGAFAGLDLDSASAADVLEAAGDSAALGVEGIGTAEWTYVRKVNVMPNVGMGQDGPKVTFTTDHETWTSADNRMNFTITKSSAPGVGAWPSLHYENLSEGTLGDVTWSKNGGGLGPRRATWTIQKSANGLAGGDGTIEMMVELREQLPEARTAEDVASVIDEVFDIGNFTYRNGTACSPPPHAGCSSWGSYMGRQDEISPANSRTMYGRGLLLNALAYDVYPPNATRAIYRFLAALDGTEVTALDDGTVQLLFPIAGAPSGTGERVVLDGNTGRVVERGRESLGGLTRWTAAGTSDEPVVGGELCSKYPDECAELRDLAKQLETDPKAQFTGVVDWMFISQFCDGMIGRDGKPLEGNDELPRSMSKDPKVKAERAACEKREAAAAQGN